MRGTTASLGLAALSCSALALSACAPSPSQGAGTSGAGGDVVKVGMISSQTGPLAGYEKEYQNGVVAGIDYATKGTGAVDGHKIEVTWRDDGGDPDKAVSAAKDLIGKGYKILGGSVDSGIALKLADQAQQNKVLFLSGPAASDKITGANEYTFRSGRQTYQDVATAATFVKPEGAKILVFAQDSAFGQGNAAAVKAVMGSKGATVTNLLVPADTTDFTSFARQIVTQKPTMVFVAWAGATTAAMWQALAQQNVFGSTTVVTGLGDSLTYGAYGAASGKVDFLNHYFPGAGGDNPVEKAMTDKLKAAGAKPDLFSPDGFVAGQMLVRAIGEGGGTDVPKMISALQGWSFEGPKGPMTIRAGDHALIQPMFQVKLTGSGTSWTPSVVTTVSPESVAPPEAK
ncbi:substrate-binding domain-containing protein [Branchiibius sp. NY16-3462-2]|uniref:substrate-binding domain-containing protein n=1 Tax=Branchiibius sp. NY16-3462-2 TaxID=1807500 RepID=UPI0007985858|nr:substrate-binding domain-containing protein [Branchiibius sp. NY16-3462-2]KYH46281.1 amino acid ABC transporter substrate-binding protein [Branchiibius sp. NY16-3462-2]